MNRIFALFTAILLLAIVPLPVLALELTGMFKSKPQSGENRRKETLERIRDVQQELKLLQDQLRTLEKQPIAGAAAQQTGEGSWQMVDQMHIDPGEFGIYTYLLFAGSEADGAASKSLEELILTIERLPATTEPAAIGNRFLLPVEIQQSTVVLSRRPYDFRLSRRYLERLGLSGLPDGPVLVSLSAPLDPGGLEMAPPFLAVVPDRQNPKRTLALARVWHGYEKPVTTASGHPMADLFWQLIDGAGLIRVSRDGGKLLIDLTDPVAIAAQ